MPIKIRLQRRGKKGEPFYHIVVADSRSARDGKFIYNLGFYNPLTNTIKISLDNAVFWLEKGAKPTATARSLFSKIGVLYNYHLRIGIQKGAFDKKEAENRFEKWIEQNNNVYFNKNLLVLVKEK